MAKKYSPVFVTPAMGGRLMTGASSRITGLFNYTVKREFRRDLDRESRAEGHDYFWPNTTGSFASNPGDQPFPLEGGDSGPITLIHYAEREDGKTAVIVGTPTRLYRFFAMEGGDVYEASVGGGDPVFVRTGPDSPVFENNPGEWITIGSGFNASAHRWEAKNINGWTIFNNGVDLPVSYHLNEMEVKPLYELREVGVARVGTIGKFSDILVTGDVSEIQTDEFEDLMRPSGVDPSGQFRATQSGVTVTAVGGTTEAFFTASDVGKTIVWDDDDETEVTVIAFVDAQNLTVDTAHTIAAPGRTFTFRVKAAQAGSTYSGSITGSIAAGNNRVTASAPIFNVGMEGDTLRFANGWSSVITSPGGFINATTVDLDDNAPEAYAGLPFYIVDSPTDNTVIATAAIFTSDMVGKILSWDDGATRLIESVHVSGLQATVDMDLTHASGLIAVEKPEAYDNYTEGGFIDRRQFRMLWSYLDYPRRFGPAFSGSIDQSSNRIVLDYPSKSLEIGQEIIVAGAGENGANLVADIVFIAADRIITIDTLASTSVTSATIQASDASGSVTGFEDPKGDMSGILKMLELGDFLVVYKDDSIILVSYTGNSSAPFVFRHEAVENAKTLYYPNTLVAVGNASHMYAGSGAFYRFDLTNRYPVEVQAAELCRSVFFDSADLEDRDDIWAADNSLTKEIWFSVPAATTDKQLCYDYLLGTFRTASRAITASATVKKPLVGVTAGVAEDWYLMGTSDGVVLVYGRAAEDVVSWGNVEAIYYQRHANPFSATKLGYSSLIKSGLSDFGAPANEKHVDLLVPHLASMSSNTTFKASLLGARNTSEGETTHVTTWLPDPSGENLIPVHYMEMFLGCQFEVPAVDDQAAQLVNNPLDLVGVSWGIKNIDTRHWIRRSTAVVA